MLRDNLAFARLFAAIRRVLREPAVDAIRLRRWPGSLARRPLAAGALAVSAVGAIVYAGPSTSWERPHWQHQNGGRGKLMYSVDFLGTLGVCLFGDNLLGNTIDFFSPAPDLRDFLDSGPTCLTLTGMCRIGMATKMNSSDSSRDDDARYFQVDFEPGDAFSFEEPTDAVCDGLRELLECLPVRPFVGDPLGQHTLRNATAIGVLDEVMRILQDALRADYDDNMRELGDVCEFKTYVMESSVRPDALDIATRLAPKDGLERGIIYGSYVQRIAHNTFALWSQRE